MKLVTPIGDFSCHFYQPDCLERFDRDRAAYRLRQELAKPVKGRTSNWVRRLKIDLAVAEIDMADARHRVVASLHRGPCTARTEDVPCVADSMAVAEITRPAGRPFRWAAMRTQGLFKAMVRLGLSKDERRPLWGSYFAQINGPLPRKCVAVITTCLIGHRHRIEAIQPDDASVKPWTRTEARLINHAGGVLFPSDREFCGHVLTLEDMPKHRGLPGNLCGLATLTAKHRYLYTVALPEGKAAKRRAQAAHRPVDTSGDDVLY